MKTMLLVSAVAFLVAAAWTAGALRADDKVADNKSDAEPAAAGTLARPVSCTPAVKDPQRHQEFMKDKEATLQKGPVRLVFIGDSITDAWRGGEQNKIYNERWGKYNPLNLGISGDKTEHVLWRLEHGELDGLSSGAKLVVMMIGTNNLGNPPRATPEDTAKGVECLVKTVRQKLPQSRLLLLAVFPRGVAADDPFRAQIKTVNDTIAKLADGKNVRFLDIGEKFLDDDGTLPKDIMPDALHPNARGYEIWADAIDPVIKEMIGEAAR
jgi:beta-glucosidase